jgi:flavin-dependent dehydrogenase
MLYQKELPVRMEVDVLVAGGGASGAAAAVAAARMGKSVLLVEAGGALGGVGTSGLVPAFAPFGDGVHILAAGIGMEIRRQLSVPVTHSTAWTPVDTEELKRVYDRIVTDAGVKVLFFTTVCDVLVSDGHMEDISSDRDPILKHQVVFIQFPISRSHTKNQRHTFRCTIVGHFRKPRCSE